MCLYNKDPWYKRLYYAMFARKAYKVFKRHLIEPEKYYSAIFPAVFRKGEWKERNKWLVQAAKLIPYERSDRYSPDPKKYQAGYHVFYNRDDAINAALLINQFYKSSPNVCFVLGICSVRGCDYITSGPEYMTDEHHENISPRPVGVYRAIRVDRVEIL